MSLSNLLLVLFLVTHLKGNVLEVGLLAGITSFSLMPSMMLWGWATDRLGRCRPFLILSFVGIGAVFLLIPAVQNVYELFILAIAKSVAYAASMPSRQILTVESENHEAWQGGLARLQFLESVGETIGLGVGFAWIGVFGYEPLFLLCGVLSFASALAAAAWVRDPTFMLQRKLVGIERFAETLATASTMVAYADSRSQYVTPRSIARLFKPTLSFFMVGVFAFSLGAAALYSPLPVYFLTFYSASSVFLLFFANTAANTLGYLFVQGTAKRAKKSLLLASVLRTALIPILFIEGGGTGFMLAALVLASMGAVWALYDIASTCMFLELSGSGRAGLYGAMAGLGSALGSLLGGFLSNGYGFGVTFVVCASIYAASLVLFVLQFRR